MTPDVEMMIEDAVYERDRWWLGHGAQRIRRAGRLPRNISEPLARLIVEAYLGLGVVRDAVDAGLAASFRTRTRPTRQSIRTIALAWLGAAVDREIDRRIAQLEREHQKGAA